MVDSRFIKSISERFDLEASRHSNPLKRLRWRISCTCGILTLLLIIAGHGTSGDAIFQSRPVTTSHASLTNRCDMCHAGNFQLPRRLFGHASGKFIRQCQHCHPQQMQDHHEFDMSRSQIQDCAACHREHRGQASLTNVADSQCVTCHQDLQAFTHPDQSDFANRVESIQEHPEIALLRDWASAPPGETHGVHRVAEQNARGLIMDRGNLQFNHAVHMRATGVLVPPGHPEYGTGESEPPRIQLQCSACHKPDSAGQRMRPVRYQQHCSSCHPLSYSPFMETADAISQTLPHESPEKIRGSLLSGLLASPPVKPPSPPGRNPAKPPPATSSTGDESSVASRLLKLERWLYAGGGTAGNGDVKNGCARCHSFQEPETTKLLANWTIAPTRIPNRWLVHARFPHNKHSLLKCTECHYRADKAGSDLITADQSTQSQHILMPSIETCRSCHKQDKLQSNAVTHGRCVDCHDYHADHTAPGKARSLQSFLNPSPIKD